MRRGCGFLGGRQERTSDLIWLDSKEDIWRVENIPDSDVENLISSEDRGMDGFAPSGTERGLSASLLSIDTLQ